MKILHLQRSSAFNTNDFQQCLLTLKNDDALVLIDDGCYCLSHTLLLKLQKSHNSVPIYYIKNHANARAISTDDNIASAIDLTKLIELTFEYDSTITWQ